MDSKHSKPVLRVAVTAGIGIVVALTALAVRGSADPWASFGALVIWLACADSLGGVSTVVLQMIRKVFPTIDEDYAVIASVLFAALTSLVAKFLVPYLPAVPPAVEEVWPILVWVGQQIWFYWFREEAKVKMFLSTKATA